MSLVATELQNAADASALGGIGQFANGQAAVIAEAQTTAAQNRAGGASVTLAAGDVEFGVFDVTKHTFTSGGANPNAIRVTARVQNHSLFFAPILGQNQFSMTRSAVAMLSPRDIVFVVESYGPSQPRR